MENYHFTFDRTKDIIKCMYGIFLRLDKLETDLHVDRETILKMTRIEGFYDRFKFYYYDAETDTITDSIFITIEALNDLLNILNSKLSIVFKQFIKNILSSNIKESIVLYKDNNEYVIAPFFDNQETTDKACNCFREDAEKTKKEIKRLHEENEKNRRELEKLKKEVNLRKRLLKRKKDRLIAQFIRNHYIHERHDFTTSRPFARTFKK